MTSTLIMNNTVLNLELEFGNCNGTMQVTISDNMGIMYNLVNVIDPIVRINHSIVLPTTLKFTISGKNYNTDTVVDSDGSISADKFVKLTNLSLGYVPISESTMFKICCYNTDKHDKSQFDNYWGFNGVVSIDFNHDSTVRWHFVNNNTFDLVNEVNL